MFKLDIYFIYLVIPFWYKAAEENVIGDSGNTLVSIISIFYEVFICNFTSASGVTKVYLKDLYRSLKVRYSIELTWNFIKKLQGNTCGGVFSR